MSSPHVVEDLTSSILDFQANLARCVLRKKMTPVEPYDVPEHHTIMKHIWQASRVDETSDGVGDVLHWRKLGFDSEDVTHEFENVGVLGLECLVRCP